MKWELVYIGSLNGMLLNSWSIYHPDFESRHWGGPIELASGDIVTLGMTS
jgi:protein phosphatase